MTKKQLRCANCRQPVAPRKENPDFPFCSERCKMIDLSRWMGGEYRIPGPPASDADIADAIRRQPSGEDDDGDDTGGNGRLH